MNLDPIIPAIKAARNQRARLRLCHSSADCHSPQRCNRRKRRLHFDIAPSSAAQCSFPFCGPSCRCSQTGKQQPWIASSPASSPPAADWSLDRAFRAARHTFLQIPSSLYANLAVTSSTTRRICADCRQNQSRTVPAHSPSVYTTVFTPAPSTCPATRPSA